MKDFIMQLLGLLVIILGGAFFLKGKIKNPFKNKNNKTEIPPDIKPLPKPPDIEKILEEFKNETPEESVDHLSRLLNELFLGD